MRFHGSLRSGRGAAAFDAWRAVSRNADTLAQPDVSVGTGLKIALGALLIITAAAILSGADKLVETALVNASPEWLTALTTQF